MQDAMLEEAIELLSGDNWKETAKETGLGYEWIKKLANNAIGDPGHLKIVKLHGYLVEKYRAKLSA